MAIECPAAQADRNPVNLYWPDIEHHVARLSHRLPAGVTGVYGVPTGGSIVSVMVQKYLPHLKQCAQPGDPRVTWIVDDLVDSGRTLQPFVEKGYKVDALIRKPHSPENIAPHAIAVPDGWIHFPWEHETGAEDVVVRLLEYIGENPLRDGLKETPGRVLRAWKELTAGYREDPKKILAKRFPVTYDEMVVVRGIRFTSICEHHLLPFTGTATVGYIPKDTVCGLSKLARLVLCFARRLQIQEGMTRQIADAIQNELDPHGVGVVVRARHSCMGCRGVLQPDAEMVTSAMLGRMRESAAARAEFLGL